MLANMMSAKMAGDPGTAKNSHVQNGALVPGRGSAQQHLHRSICRPADERGLLRQGFNGCA
jgi:hypothetical protein